MRRVFQISAKDYDWIAGYVSASTEVWMTDSGAVLVRTEDPDNGVRWSSTSVLSAPIAEALEEGRGHSEEVAP